MVESSHQNEDMGSKSRWRGWKWNRLRRRQSYVYLLVLSVLAFTVYILTTSAGVHIARTEAWLEEDPPDDGDMSVYEVEISFRISWTFCSVRALRCGPRAGALVVLLHGARYTSETWKKIGTYPELCSKGYAVVGIDLPGYGGTPEDCGSDKAAFMNGLMSNLAYSSSSKISIISPSMSGAFTAAALTQPRVVQHLSSIIWVAPVGIQSLDVYPSSIQTLIIYGDKDSIGIGSEHQLRQFPRHTVKVLQRAGHACYFDTPLLFHRSVLAFLSSVYSSEKTSGSS